MTALAWWGVHLARIMLAGRRIDVTEQNRPRPDRITQDLTVADVLRWFPQTMSVFDRHGFSLLQNPVARRTLARGVTVAQAAALRRVPLPQLVNELTACASADAMDKRPDDSRDAQSRNS